MRRRDGRIPSEKVFQFQKLLSTLINRMTEANRDGFTTIFSEGYSEIRVMASVFCGVASTVSSPDEAETRIIRIQSRYPDAAHYPYAYRIFDGAHVIERQSDDGEPSGTAGKPVLLALQQAEVLNAGIFVARYFGGKKLGTGRLFHAFAECAFQALENAGRHFRQLTIVREIQFPYQLTNAVNRAVSEGGASILSSHYSENVAISVEIPRSQFEKFKHLVHDYSGGRIFIE